MLRFFALGSTEGLNSSQAAMTPPACRAVKGGSAVTTDVGRHAANAQRITNVPTRGCASPCPSEISAATAAPCRTVEHIKPMTVCDFALFDLLPELKSHTQRVALGEWPTPIEPLEDGSNHQPNGIWIKREDLSSPAYGGNKIRPLELMFGIAHAKRAKRIWSTGAYGSNHALASAIHAQRVGLHAGAILCPQPSSITARANLRSLLSLPGDNRLLSSVLQVPAQISKIALNARLSRDGCLIMAPGAATPEGAFAHLGAGLELALQVAAGVAPEPHHIVLGLGSTCTTAGLIVGIALAGHLGIAFSKQVPIIEAIRVTPWPVTAPWRIATLAYRTAALLRRRGGPDLGLTLKTISHRFRVHGEHLGLGYGLATPDGRRAQQRLQNSNSITLDTTYSEKSAAGLFAVAQRSDVDGPLLYWATKSTAPLPPISPDALRKCPLGVQRWLRWR